MSSKGPKHRGTYSGKPIAYINYDHEESLRRRKRREVEEESK